MTSAIEDRIDEAIKHMDEARESHQLWIEYYADNPELEKTDLIQTTGNTEHNQRWVDRYDKTIKILLELKGK